VVFSNHGGRQIEDCPAPLDVLRGFTGEGGAPAGALLVDSGFRTGADIAKALALGADAVMIGRPTLYGLAAAGEEGVQQVLDILRDELDNTLALIGCPAAADLDAGFIA
jgi:(S)-mandelate dehydrogenase